jgi:hypothetical protein
MASSSRASTSSSRRFPSRTRRSLPATHRPATVAVRAALAHLVALEDGGATLQVRDRAWARARAALGRVPAEDVPLTPISVPVIDLSDIRAFLADLLDDTAWALIGEALDATVTFGDANRVLLAPEAIYGVIRGSSCERGEDAISRLSAMVHPSTRIDVAS